MRAPIIVTLALMLAGCEKPNDWFPTYPPEYFAHWSDRMKERFPELQSVFGPSCIWRDENGPVLTEECLRMEKPRRWRGLWRNAFEGSRFCPDGELERAENCSYESYGPRIWFEPKTGRDPDYKLYRVDFIGRQTLYRGSYGHLGGSDHEMIVDEWISIKEVPGPLRE